MSRVLVTGAGGFIGEPALRALAARGHELHALTRGSPAPEDGLARWHTVDLDDRAALGELLDRIGADRLLHLAWFVEPGLFWESPENLTWVGRSLSLLRGFAEAGGRRAVMVGTCAEYDWSAAAGPLREQAAPIAPRTLYGVSKDALRRVAGAYAEKQGIGFAWGRLFFLYGPREAPGRLVSSVARSLLAGEEVETTSGTQRRDFLHVGDAAAALAALLDSDVDGAVNIASGDAPSVAEVVERLAAEAGAAGLVRRGALPDRAEEPPLLLADVTRLRTEVGFSPRLSLAEGIADTVSWWRRQLGEAAAAPDGPGGLG